ncbi:MAG: hypothetical protein WC998_05375 [Candidatus Paceibacterota bacterium]|jgi:hypothetical protein
MVNLIVNQIVQEITIDLPFVDKITGIVKTAKIQDGQNNVKTLPIAYNLNPTTCDDSELLDYIPDSSKKSIIYFEDRGTQMQKMENNSIYFQSNFTLVCWFNYLKIDQTLTNTSQITGNLIKFLPEIMNNISPLIGVVLSINSEQPNDGAVFSKYSYLEEINQFITYPYGYVALDLSAEYHVRKECITDIVLNPSTC